ncbi:helix-turn-helix domain-containing protein [Paenibacillus sp. Y412MC10]|uniref:helix-turn-helix domain-containing protein n=1 Tax=Geobacillus sp. (strain Y412MC10) TaxID=481743 RepID=UPI001642BA7C|nr:helix-turn-helix domain-containing protein [Paenibacillus sp. Y412MC10]
MKLLSLDPYMKLVFGDACYGIWMFEEKNEQLFRWKGTEDAERLLERYTSSYGLPERPSPGHMEHYSASLNGRQVQSMIYAPGSLLEGQTLLLLVDCPKPPSLPEKERILAQLWLLLLEEVVDKQKQDHERWLEGLRALTSSLDLGELLLGIMQNALKVIPSADCGFFMMFDKKEGRLLPKASIGIKDDIYQFRIMHSEGITGKVFSSGQGRIYNSRTAMDAMEDIPLENMNSLVSAFGGSMVRARAVMAVPVTMNKDKIGVMLIHQLNEGKRPFSEQDLHQLQGFADQAAIAIANARLYSELRESNRYLVKRSEIHHIFTKLSARQENVETVAVKMGEMLGLPVVFADVLVGSLHPPQPEGHELASLDMYQTFATGISPVTVQGPSSGAGYYLYPVVNGDILLGTFLLPLYRPLEPIDHVVLEQGGMAVALQLMTKHSATEMYYKRSHEFFHELISFREPERVESKLKNFGLPRGVPLFVSVLHLLGEHEDLKQRDMHLRRLIACLEKELAGTQRLLFGSHDKVTIISAARHPRKREQIVSSMKTAVERWSRFTSKSVSGGIGGLYDGLQQVARSNGEATDALSFLLRRGKTGLTRYEEIGVNQLFLNQEPAKIENYIHGILSPLRSGQVQQGEELERTLKVYLAMNRSPSATAERLHIHINTLYHRLRKIEELLGVDMNDSDDWLKVCLACHLSETY